MTSPERGTCRGFTGSLRQPRLDSPERLEDVLDPGLRLRRRVERSFRLEVDAIDVRELHALAAEGRDELLAGHELVVQVALADMAVLVQGRRRALQHPVEPAVPEGEADEQVVHGEED